MSDSPPGYVRAEAEPGGLRPATLLAAQVLLTAALLLASARELVLRAPALYLAPLDHSKSARFWGLALGLALGAFLAHRRPAGARRAIWSLAAVSALTSTAPLAWSFAFSSSNRFVWLAQLIMGSAGCALGFTAASSAAWLAPHARALGLLVAMLSPLPLVMAALVGALALGAATQLPVAQAGAAIGLALGLLCAAAAPLERYLTRERLRPADRLVAPALTLVISVLAFARGERALPRAEVRGYGGDVLTLVGERQRLAQVSHRSHFELYADRTLKLSSLDAHRYAEALVHPAMAAAREHRRILLLGGGTGVVEREILRWKGVEKLIVIATDGALSFLAWNSPWLAPASAFALDDRRLEVSESEPIVWLARSNDRFDVIIADIEDPTGYRQGKHFTRHAFTLLSKRLAEGGVASVQAPSPFTFPRAFASIRVTLADAGLAAEPYHAALPAIGDAGFFLFAAPGGRGLAERVLDGSRELPSGLRYVTAPALAGFFHFPADLRPALIADAPVNTLHTQKLVDLYAEEHERQPER